LHQVDQHIEGFWPQRQHGAVTAQASRSAIDDKSPETIASGLRQIGQEIAPIFGLSQQS
jgi:hypothetical protein